MIASASRPEQHDNTRYLKVAKGAVFDDRENEKSPLCHPQTRERLLAEIAQWAEDPEGKCIFWLRGAAGTGKSTISRTIAKSFSDKGKLAASFFFNRTIDDCRKADLFVTTIANQLIRNVHRAQNIQELEELIRNVIQNDTDLPSKGLKMQFQKLILGPLKELGLVGSSTTTLVLAIDALDECDNEAYTGAGPYFERTRMIVGLLSELASVTGIRLVSGLDECDHKDVIVRFRKIVGSIILLADPLPVRFLSRLLDDTEDEVFLHLKNLHSVLSVPDDPKSDEPVKVFHLSFPEYLLDRSQKMNRFFIDEQQTHTDLLDCCLRVMKNKKQHCLKNDICHLEDPGVLKKEVALEKIREYIPQYLEYACVYWVYHLEKTHYLIKETEVYDFLSQFFVHWLEAMSWLGRIEQSVSDVRKLRAIFHSSVSKIGPFLEDAARFVAEHKYTIDRAPCQVYVSGLLFSPRNSIVKRKFQSEIPDWVLRAPEIGTAWDITQRSLHTYRSDVIGMCYSDDGVYLAIATENKVNIWNVESDTLYAAKDNFTSKVSVIASRSANNIAVALRSGSVVFWDWKNDQQFMESLSESGVAYISSSANGDLVCGFCDGGVYLWKQNLGIVHRWKTCWRPSYSDWDEQRQMGLPVTGISYSIDGRMNDQMNDEADDEMGHEMDDEVDDEMYDETDNEMEDEVDDETYDETDNEVEDEVDDDMDEKLDDAVISEGDDGDNKQNNERTRDNCVFVFSAHDGACSMHSEPIKNWGIEHAKFFSVGFMDAASVVVEPRDWLRLKHMSEQYDTPEAAANGVSCDVHPAASVHWIQQVYENGMAN
ncbi:nacht and wd40 domain protein [Colletotrichum kahawae]|uniref:Nacht and wd40 domain protein n=1 Tax=Colletotrichum kahawae TaxID=34407 RepID=A0AAD9Y9Q5_COLKA|nr:nacht and wd40 domain protein [Colletotrichum kahawae]